MTARFLHRFAVAAVAAAMAWVALWSWGGLVEQPGHFLSPALVGALLVVGVGSAGRTLGWPWYAVLPAQLVVLVLWLDHRYAAADALGGWVPTPESIRRVADPVHAGAVAVNTYASPVSSEHRETYVYLLATSLVVMLCTDLLACGMRRVPWAGLPVIVTLTVPISVLDDGLSWVVFVITSLLFIMLLATEETERVLSWGRSVAGRGEPIDSLDQVVNGSTIRGSALRIGVLTAAGALVLPILVPVTNGLFKGNGDGGGDGDGNNSVTLKNPIVDMRRDLVEKRHIPFVEARTAADPGYLRLTVLDKFNGVEWSPSARKLSASNNANGRLPSPPGQGIPALGREDDWSLRLLNGFKSTWLPTPYPTRTIDVKKGDWRYDVRTLDIATVDKQDTRGLAYDLVGFTPQLSGSRMEAALAPPTALLEAMTSVPGTRTDVVKRIAEDVTADAKSDYARVVALQTWFRDTGGFSYSLDAASGNGMDQLVRFLTVDKVGYCEQYAAAMAVMARTLGIPARVAVGFLAPQRLDDGTYLYTSDDMHAWPEVYFGGSGWVRFEPTPSDRTGPNPPPWTVGGGAPLVPTSSPSATDAPDARTSKAPLDQAGPTDTESSSSNRSTAAAWVVGVLLLLLLLALPSFLRTRQRRHRLGDHRRGPLTDDARVLADGAWEELCATARDLGIRLPLQRSVREISATLRRRAYGTTDAVRRLDDLTLFVERARYARPFAVDPATRQAVVEAVETWAGVMAASVPTRRSRFARLFPRSVLDRRTSTPVVDRQVELAGAGKR
jgi:transglutaminase-like putative cysteine protease